MSEVGRCSLTKARPMASRSASPESGAIAFMKSATPSDRVGPGRTLFTVTPVPDTVSARPREIASCAVFVMP